MIFDRVKFIGPGSSISIGNNVQIWRYSELNGQKENPIVIGDNCFINQGVIIRPNVSIGNKVNIGPRTMIISDSHEIGKPEKRAGKPYFPRIIIGNGCWIGANVTILGPIEIGEGTIIAAGSVVNKNCKSNSLYAGVPAKFIKNLD